MVQLMKANRRLSIGVSLALVLVYAGVITAAPARLYRNPAFLIDRFYPPYGWEPLPQSSYPRLLALYQHREGGRMTLVAERISPALTTDQFLEMSTEALKKQGYFAITVRPDGPKRRRLEAKRGQPAVVIRQLYQVEHQPTANFAYVITVSCPATGTRALGDFEPAVQSFVLLPEPPPVTPDLGVTTPRDAGGPDAVGIPTN